MRGYGPLSLVFGVIFGAAYLLIQFNLMSSVSEAIGMQAEPAIYRDETAAAAADVAERQSYEILDMNGRATPAKRAAPLLTPDRFTDERRARFTTYVDPAALLKDGEAMPEGEMQALMVEARATRLADLACTRLAATIAAECGVRGFEASKIGPPADWMDEERTRQHTPFAGTYVLTTTMVFTPADPVGSLPDSARVTLHRKTFQLDPWTATTPSDEEIWARTGTVLAAAARACADIREVHGNCTVTEIVMSHDRTYAGEFRSSFELAWLTPLRGAALAEAEAPGADAAQGNAPDGSQAPRPPAPSNGGASPKSGTDPAPAPSLNGGKAGKWVSP